MYDELVKELREAEKEAKKLFTNPYRFVPYYGAAANAIETLSKLRWIPVTEEPPLKVGDDGYNGYLVYANGHYEVADYMTDEVDNVPYFHVDGEYETDVTHYMPLPEPPEKRFKRPLMKSGQN